MWAARPMRVLAVLGRAWNTFWRMSRHSLASTNGCRRLLIISVYMGPWWGRKIWNKLLYSKFELNQVVKSLSVLPEIGLWVGCQALAFHHKKMVCLPDCVFVYFFFLVRPYQRLLNCRWLSPLWELVMRGLALGALDYPLLLLTASSRRRVKCRGQNSRSWRCDGEWFFYFKA